MKKNPIIRDIIMCLFCGTAFYALRKLGQYYNLSSDKMFYLGIYSGIFVCFLLDALSTFIMNIYMIIKFTILSPEDFGKFLKGAGVEIEELEDDIK